MLDHDIIIAQVCLIDRLILLRDTCLTQKDRVGHESTVFAEDFTHPVFIGKFQRIVIQEKRDSRSDFFAAAFADLIGRLTRAFPVDRCCTFLIGKRLDMNFIGDHKSRVEPETEMADHLIFIGLILVLLKKLCSAGKGDLCDILLNFRLSHSKAVVAEGQRFFAWIDDDLNCRFVVVRTFIFTDHIKLLKLCDSVSTVGDHFTCKNVVI